MPAIPVSGSSNRVNVPDDLGSEAFRELVDQLNKASITGPVILVEEAAGLGGSGYSFVGAWGVDTYIRDILFMNRGAAIANAATDILIKKAKLTDFDVGGPPTSPETLFELQGFTANFPPVTAIWGRDLIEGTHTDLVVGSPHGLKVLADEYVYVELVNTEGGAIEFEVLVSYSPVDYMNLGPRGTQKSPRGRVRNFNRVARKSTDQ